jgi:hypothetical protein
VRAERYEVNLVLPLSVGQLSFVAVFALHRDFIGPRNIGKM